MQHPSKVAVALLLASLCTACTQPADVVDPLASFKVSVEQEVKLRLRDPDSAKFEWEQVQPSRDVACGSVNAKNGFGGYSGADSFAFNSGRVILESENAKAYLAGSADCLIAESEVAIERLPTSGADPATIEKLRKGRLNAIDEARALRNAL